ncbi:MAG: hypothetical protein IPH83_00060 [Gammaproteobacteria bacterium]|nr:hypothetical protein [Gammaproteobacteria bacterium]
MPDSIPSSDLGLVLIFGGLGVILLNRNANFRNCLNIFGFFSLAYLLLVAAHASIAAFYYQQPIIDGLIAARKQYYYLSFFLFAVLLSDRDRIRSTLDLLSLLALVLFFLGLVNYFVHPIFHHKWAEGQGIRAASPVDIFRVCRSSSWPASGRPTSWSRHQNFHAVALRHDSPGGGTVPPDTWPPACSAWGDRVDAVDQQALEHSAARLIGAVPGYHCPEYLHAGKPDRFGGDLDLSDISEGGTGARADTESEQLAETFWTGSGGVTIRATGGWEAIGSTLGLIRRNIDLGYFVWLKFFGLPGLILLLVLFAGYANHVLNIRHVTVPGIGNCWALRVTICWQSWYR